MAAIINAINLTVGNGNNGSDESEDMTALKRQLLHAARAVGALTRYASLPGARTGSWWQLGVLSPLTLTRTPVYNAGARLPGSPCRHRSQPPDGVGDVRGDGAVRC